MTLEEIYYISQIVAVVAIFASLIFVGVQVRQNSEQIKANTRSIKAAAAFEGTHSWAATNETIAADWSDEFLRMALATYDPEKTWNDFTDIDRSRVSLVKSSKACTFCTSTATSTGRSGRRGRAGLLDASSCRFGGSGGRSKRRRTSGRLNLSPPSRRRAIPPTSCHGM
jgi:hypothetical protein